MPKALIILGLVIAAIGLAMQFGVPLGRLPGDIVVRRGDSTFYFPFVTCLVVSVALSIVGMLLRR